MTAAPMESWGSGDAYERYVGRWSRQVAVELLRWLAPARGLTWADVGCGTGALAATILAGSEPAAIEGLDTSEGFVAAARERVRDPRARFVTGDATRLPWEAGAFDLTVSGLVLNFVRDHAAMAREMARVTKPGGRVCLYVWDYAGGMQMIRHFWDAVIAVSPGAAKLDQADRFPICQPEPLRALFEGAGLRAVAGPRPRDPRRLPGLRRLLDPVPRPPGLGPDLPGLGERGHAGADPGAPERAARAGRRAAHRADRASVGGSGPCGVTARACR